MSFSTSRPESEDRSHFRCPVVEDRSQATVKIAGRKIAATVVETSIGGYTITVDAKHRKRFTRGTNKAVISYDDTKAIVSAEWISEPENGLVRIGLHQEKDLTKPERVVGSFWSHFMPTRDPSGSNVAVAYGGFVLFLFAAMAMPGLGDQLGTSNRIQNTFRWLISNASQQFDLWLR